MLRTTPELGAVIAVVDAVLALPGPEETTPPAGRDSREQPFPQKSAAAPVVVNKPARAPRAPVQPAPRPRPLARRPDVPLVMGVAGEGEDTYVPAPPPPRRPRGPRRPSAETLPPEPPHLHPEDDDDWDKDDSPEVDEDAVFRCLPAPPTTEVLAARVNGLTYKAIKGEKEADLIRRYQAGDRNAGELLVHAHSKLIEHFSLRHGRGHHDLFREDIIAEGTVGFLKGVKKFDSAAGFQLGTYVQWWIRAAVERAKSNEGHTIRVPVYLHDRAVEEQRGPGDKMILAKRAAYAIERLDAPVDSDNGNVYTLLDTVADPAKTPEDTLLSTHDHRVVKAIVKNAGLTPRERRIVDWRLLTDEPSTLGEVGDAIGLSRERVRQLEVIVLRKLHRAATQLGERPAFTTPRAAHPPESTRV